MLSAAGAAWLRRTPMRAELPAGQGQVLLDCSTGAPFESVLAVGAMAFGLIVGVIALP